jgi:hypothetical protein
MSNLARLLDLRLIPILFNPKTNCCIPYQGTNLFSYDPHFQ